MSIATQPPKSNSPSPLESRRDDLKIAQGKASLRAPPWVNVPKILFPLAPSEGGEGRGEGFLQRLINWCSDGGLPFFDSLEMEAATDSRPRQFRQSDSYRQKVRTLVLEWERLM